MHGVIGFITYNACQAVPFHTNIVFDVVLNYNAPTINAFPELSSVGAVAFAPKYTVSQDSLAICREFFVVYVLPGSALCQNRPLSSTTLSRADRCLRQR